jgi:hypothetical protein
LVGVGCYAGYAGSLLKHKVGGLERFVIVGLSIFGLYYLITQALLLSVRIVKRWRVRASHARGDDKR